MNEQHKNEQHKHDKTLRIGIDIGNVLMGSDTDEPDLIFHDKRYLEATAIPGAFEAVTALSECYGPGNIFLVSKCGKTIQQRSLEWLEHHRFYEVTGVRRDHVEFCRERRQKRDICERLGIGAELEAFRSAGPSMSSDAPAPISIADDRAVVLADLL